mgnify:CR=1 FL=1
MILVTGGTGLGGSHLLAELSKSDSKIRAIYRSEKSLEKTKLVFKALQVENQFAKIEWFKADLEDYFDLEKAFEGVEFIYHAAAKVSFAAKDVDDLMKTNIDGTTNLVNLALDNKVKKFCYVSSVASLGSYPNGKATDEEALWQMNKNTSNYSVSKYYAENEVWRASEEGLDVVIVNPATIIGFGDWNDSSSTIVKKVYDGLKFYPSGGNGFVSVNDVVKAMMLIMQNDIKNERYILVNENLKFIELFTKLAKAFEKAPPQKLISKQVAQVGIYLEKLRSIFTGNPPILTKESIDTAYRIKSYSNQKIKQELNFEFENFDTSLQKTCQYYLDYQIEN